MSDIKKVFKEFKDTLFSYPAWSLVFIAVVAFIAHGAMIFSNAIGIDTEAATLGVEAYDGQGRQGILWLRKILGMSKFNLWLTNSLTFFLLILVALVFFTAIVSRRRKMTGLLVPFCLIFIVSPYFACQLYFLSQSVPVLVSLLLIPLIHMIVSAAFVEKTSVVKRILLLLAGVVLFQLVVGTYQVNLIIYVAYVCCVFAIDSLHGEDGAGRHFKFLAWQAVFVIVGFVIYEIITALFYSAYSSYLTDQIAWGEAGIKGGIINIIHVVGDSFKGAGLYSFLYMPLCLAAFVFTIINSCKAKEKFSQVIFPILCELFVFVSPFFFVILLGSDVTPRMRYLFPIAESFVLLIGGFEYERFTDGVGDDARRGLVKKIVAVCFCLLLFADTMKGLNNTTRLYYTNEYRFERETLIAKDLKQDLDVFFRENALPDSERGLVVFLGEVNIEYNDICLPGAASMGSSSLNWDSYVLNRGRLYKFMKAIGYSVGDPPYFSDGAFLAYKHYFDEYFGAEVDAMPVYPYEGYIKEVRNDELGLHYYVVKLGYDWRKDNLFNH